MALKLQLDNNVVKEYCTCSSYGGGENDYTPPTCETKCGMKWNPYRKPDEKGCNHFDCAMYVLKDNITSFPKALLFLTVMMLFWILIGNVSGMLEFYIAYLIIVTIVFSIFSGWSALQSSKKRAELTEFRDHGTINGIKAHKL